MGSGGSSSGSGRGRGRGGGQQNAVKGIALLQGAVGKARTSDLLSAYSQLQKKNIQNMSNEEKMVRSVATDELAKRGVLIYDPKSGDYIKNSSKNPVVYDTESERSYRINSVKAESYGGTSIKVADAEYYYGGKWHEVKNIEKRKQLARRR